MPPDNFLELETNGFLMVHSFGVFWIRISDPRSLMNRSWGMKGTDKTTLVTD